MDMKLEHERQKQNVLLHERMNERKSKANNLLQANEIMDRAKEAEIL